MYITVNSAGCGQGKSYDNKQLITKQASDKFLVIVPSIALANEYNEVGCVIVSETSKNVRKSVITAIHNNVRVIVITQTAFLDFPNKELLCNKRVILQDEHLEPLYTCKWKMTNHTDWLDMFTVTNIDDQWSEIKLNVKRCNEFLVAADMLDNKEFVQDLLNTPQRIFTNRTTVTDDTLIFRVISPEIYNGSKSVHIACANFTVNRQYHLWKEMFNTKFKTTRKFVKYNTPSLTIHYADQMVNSKTYNKHNSAIKEVLLQYINANTSGEKIVYVDNNAYDDIRGWTRVTHNCHGINIHAETAHIAILSAINYSNEVVSFLSNFAHMSSASISASLIGEIAHQVIMRGSLRNQNGIDRNANKCDIYLAEQQLAMYLNAFIFNNATTCLIPGTAREVNELPVDKKDTSKAVYIRSKFPEFKDTSTRDLICDPIWHLTNSRGSYTKAYKDAIKEMQTKSVSQTTNSTIVKRLTEIHNNDTTQLCIVGESSFEHEIFVPQLYTLGKTTYNTREEYRDALLNKARKENCYE